MHIHIHTYTYLHIYIYIHTHRYQRTYTHVHMHIPHTYFCLSDLWCVIESNCCRDKWSAEALLLAVREIEGAAQRTNGLMLWGGRGSPCWMSALPTSSSRQPHSLHRVQRTSQDSTRPRHQFFYFPSVPVSASTSSADHCIEKGRYHDRDIRSLAGSCTLGRTSVSSAGGGDSGPSCTGRQCSWSSPVCYLGEHPGTCKSPLSQCLFPGCSAVRWGGLSPEVHVLLLLLCLASVYLESVGLTPTDKVTDDPFIFLVIPIWYVSDDGRIIWELLDKAVVQIVPEV